MLLTSLLLSATGLLPVEDWLVARPLSKSAATFTTEPDGTMLLSNGLASSALYRHVLHDCCASRRDLRTVCVTKADLRALRRAYGSHSRHHSK